MRRDGYSIGGELTLVVYFKLDRHVFSLVRNYL